MCGAPIVLNMLVHAPAEVTRRVRRAGRGRDRRRRAARGGDRGMEAMGFHVTHLYGLTEIYGPATVCVVAGGVGRAAARPSARG